jgi:hypothetical protein
MGGFVDLPPLLFGFLRRTSTQSAKIPPAIFKDSNLCMPEQDVARTVLIVLQNEKASNFRENNVRGKSTKSSAKHTEG